MVPEIEAGIADIKKGGLNFDVQAAFQFGLVALQIPQALDACEMKEDVKAIKEWAYIFTNAEQLAATVTKHYLFHKTDIMSDMSTLSADWDQDLYFKAGVDLADLMTLAIGPIEAHEPTYVNEDCSSDFSLLVSRIDGPIDPHSVPYIDIMGN